MSKSRVEAFSDGVLAILITILVWAAFSKANMHLLYWLSLLPFATAWVRKTGLTPVPIALYGFILAMAAVAYFVLARTVVGQDGPDSAG